jgi:hypothetical protein
MKVINDIIKIVKMFLLNWKEFVLEFTLGLIITLIILLWFVFTTFSVLFVDSNDLPILEYITITLTLFGFTLVGGIFEKKDPDKLPPIAKRLFKDSLLFLSSGSCFLLAYSISLCISFEHFMIKDLNLWVNIFILVYIIGALILAIAIGRLLLDLFLFFMNIKENPSIGK